MPAGATRPTGWSLVVFTVGTQAAVGACVARFFVWAPPEAHDAAVLPVTLLLLGISVGAAVLHLGSPGAARFALSNFRYSWLSREMTLGVAFGTLVVFDLLGIRYASLAAAAAGLALVYAISRLYRLRTVPPWNTWRTPAAFFGTAALLGAAVLATVLVAELGDDDHGVVAQLAAIVTVAAAVQMAATVHPGRRDLVALRVALTVLGTAAVLLATGPAPTLPALGTGLGLLTAGELLGRRLFYAAHRRIGL